MNYFKFILQIIVTVTVISSHAGAYVDFFRALKSDDESAISELLKQGFDPNSVDESGQPALFCALRDGAVKVSAILLAHPTLQPDQANASGETPLMMAALKGQAALVARLLERGAAVNRDGWSPLHYAAAGPDPSIVQMLVERGARIESRSPNGTTPLMMAAQYGPEDAVLLLLAGRADPALRNDLGLSAADFARRGGRENLAARLDAARR
jgi:hypothetical protein